MRIVYFTASQFDYGQVIYPGVGAPFGRSYGWQVETLDRLEDVDFDVAVIDPRLEAVDVPLLERYFRRPASARRPIFFKVTDSGTILRASPGQKYAFDVANEPGVHYASAYDPAGPFADFVATLTSSKLARLPFVYDVAREINVPMAGRRRKVILTGRADRKIYPLRHKMVRTRERHPFGRLFIDHLKHPGYADVGEKPKHDIKGERFVQKLAEYTHMFVCPLIYSSEIMKYVECAYAGCVLIGELPASLKGRVPSQQWSKGVLSLWHSLRIPEDESREMAAEYRAGIKRLRDPNKLAAEFEAVAALTI